MDLNMCPLSGCPDLASIEGRWLFKDEFEEEPASAGEGANDREHRLVCYTLARGQTQASPGVKTAFYVRVQPLLGIVKALLMQWSSFPV